MNTNNEANNNGSQAISLDLANIKAYEWFSKINTNAVTDSEKEYVEKLLTTIALNGIQDSVTFADSRLVYIGTKMLINHSMSETLIPEYGVSEYSIYLSYVKSFYDADNSARNEIIEFVTLWLSYLVNEYVMNDAELRQLSSLANTILEYVNTMEVVYKKVPDFVIATLLDVSKWEVGEPVMPIDNADIQNADLGERETEVNEGSDENLGQIKELQDASETFQFLISSGANEQEVKELQEAIETFDFLLLSLQLQKLGLTEMEQDAMQALILNLTEEPSYTSVNEEDLSAATGIDTKKMRGVLASLVKKGIIYIDKAGSELELINLNKDFWYLHPQWKNEVDNYPQLQGKYAKGGKLSNKATYIPKRDIAEIEVEKDGKTTFVDGANLYDGVYVKKGQYGQGGNVEGLQTEIHNLKRKLVAQAKSKGISENFGQKEVRMLEEKYPMNYSVGQFDEWVQNFDLDSYAKGGKLSNKATYISKRDIAEIEVEANGKTRFVDGANLFDGVYVKKGKYGQGGKVTNVDDEIATFYLKEKVKAKMKKNDVVIHFAYTDYGGDFLDKVAIEYFKENYPKNIVVESTGYSGENAFVFGKPAKEWVESTENYILGFEDFESFYYEKISEAEQEGFEELIGELEREEYEFNVGKVLDWLFENKGGFYNITTQGLDFSSSELTEELLQEGLIEKAEYAKGGTARRYFEDVKKTVSKGYNKSKEYTQKKIHDINKKIALDVLDKTKNKVDNLKKLDLKEAEKIVQKSYAKGGTAGKYNSLMELYNLRDAGYTTVSLNGFEESIGYVIDLRLDDKDLKKIGEMSYITTYEKGGDVKKKTWVAIFRKGSEQKVLEVEAATEQDARTEAEKGRNTYGLSKDLFLYDLFMKYEKGGEVRKLNKSDAILYKKEVWYVTEKNGVMGIANFSPGAWGFNYPFIPLNKVDLSEATDFYGNKVEYAKGGVANSIKYNFKLYTPDEFEYSLKDEKRKIDLLRKFIDFDEVIGSVDYEKMKDNTVLNFLLNKKKVMALVGHFNENSGQLEAVIEADGNTAELNYHPFDGMSGVDFYTLEENIKKAFKSMNMYNAVVSVEGYEEYAESIEGLENAKSRIKDIKGNTKFQVVKGENVGVGKRVDSSNVIAEYADGGVVKKVKTLNDIQNDPRVSDIYKDNSTGEPGYWMSLKEGYVSAWDRGNSVRSENLAYLKDMLNTPGGIITKQEFDTTFAEDEYANGGKMQDYYDGQGDEGEGETFEELRGQIIRGLVEDLRVSRDTAEKIVNENEAKLTYLIESEAETNIYTLVTKIQGDEDEYSNGGEMGKGDVTFIQYKDNEIMYEPNYNKYYANDVEFDSLEQAKNFLDSGQMSGDVRGAYERGLFAGGGRSKKSTYTILDDAGDEVVENADEEAVILFANTMFYYDTMDSGEEQIETFDEAVSGLKSMDYSVQKVKMAESGSQQLKNK